VQVRAHAQTQPEIPLPPVFTAEPEPVPTTPPPIVAEQDLSGFDFRISPAQQFQTTSQNAAMAGMAASLRPPLTTVPETVERFVKEFLEGIKTDCNFQPEKLVRAIDMKMESMGVRVDIGEEQSNAVLTFPVRPAMDHFYTVLKPESLLPGRDGSIVLRGIGFFSRAQMDEHVARGYPRVHLEMLQTDAPLDPPDVLQQQRNYAGLFAAALNALGQPAAAGEPARRPGGSGAPPGPPPPQVPTVTIPTDLPKVQLKQTDPPAAVQVVRWMEVEVIEHGVKHSPMWLWDPVSRSKSTFNWKKHRQEFGKR
jgi:hypothetical protein